MTAIKPIQKTRKILIIEDEADICLLLNIILKEDAVEVEHVNNLANAKEFLLKEQPSVILLDHKLPDGRGLEFVEYLRVNYPAIKIVMLTAHQPSTSREIAMSDNADIFLQKPFTREQVYDSVKSLFN